MELRWNPRRWAGVFPGALRVPMVPVALRHLVSPRYLSLYLCLIKIKLVKEVGHTHFINFYAYAFYLFLDQNGARSTS